MSRNVEIRGVFRGERHVFENGPESRVVIGTLTRDDASRSEITIKGDAPEGGLLKGMEYRLFGQWRDHHRHGRQFWFVSFVADEPATEEGVLAYLKQCKGVGPGTAHLMWEEFGDEAVRKLREHPEEVAKKIPRFSKAKAKEASELLRERHGRERVTIDLLGLLAGRGFPHKTVDRAITEWHLDAPKIIRRNPYALMTFKGCGFLKCDKFYLDLGYDPAKLKRQALCAWHSVSRDSDGSTWHPRAKVESAVRASIAGVKARPARAVELAVRAGMLAVREYHGRHWLAERRKADNEETVAKAVLQAIEEGRQDSHAVLWPDVAELDAKISDHQRAEIAKATAGMIGVLRGAPGTGKTYSAAGLIKAIIPLYGPAAIAVAAPTGKAAVRLTEALDAAGVSLAVSTVHRLLKVQAAGDGGWGFYHGEREPLPHRFVIIDESSMLDTDLAASLLRARAAGTHVLFVGDPYQLPPVGHGRPFLDLMTGGVPTGELKEIRRNSGRIVQACAEIRDRRTFDPSPAMDVAGGENLIVTERKTPADQLDNLDLLLARLAEGGAEILGRVEQVDPIWDVQVLVAVNKKSELARAPLNKRLQALLNPEGDRLPNHPFRIGDKVVCLKNGWYAEQDGPRGTGDIVNAAGTGTGASEAVRNDDGKVFVANGELGEVAGIDHGRSVVRLTAPDRLVVVPHGTKTAKENDGDENGNGEASDDSDNDNAPSGAAGDWDLGYALSVHKSQGSDWPVVIVMVDDGGSGRRVSTRNWLYTAISRAKCLCLLVGRKQAALEFCTRDGIAHRKTFLAELLRREEVTTPAVSGEEPRTAAVVMTVPAVLSPPARVSPAVSAAPFLTSDDLSAIFAPV